MYTSNIINCGMRIKELTKVFIAGDSMPIEPTFGMIREAASLPIVKIRMAMIDRESAVYPDRDQDVIFSKYNSMCDKVLRQTYIENDCTDGGYAGTELEDGESWENISTIWDIEEDITMDGSWT